MTPGRRERFVRLVGAVLCEQSDGWAGGQTLHGL
jgi:hypothetical protein